MTIEQVGAVAPDVLLVRVQAGRLVQGRQIPYQALSGQDRVDTKGEQHRWVVRNGGVIGALVGRRGDTLFTFDQFFPDAFDVTQAERPDNYRIAADGDENFRVPVRPLQVFRKSFPVNMAQTGIWEFGWPMAHALYLKLPAPLRAGQTYRISTANGLLPPFNFRFDPDLSLSDAVHVTQVGFRPDDPIKVGYLSTWRGNGGGQVYPADLTFHLIDENSGAVVSSGPLRLSRGAREAEDNAGRNHNRADVYAMDFSSVNRSGMYRLCVSGIGCSLSFPIANAAWRDAFFVSVRGLYHQRSGIALGPPFTNYQRPRNMHPDDGIRVFNSSAPLMDTGNGLNARGQDKDNFGLLNRGRGKQILPDAWGGYADAGDWDRRAQHLRIANLMIELFEMFPDYFAGLSLNLPESKNRMPDLLDEALWGVDFFKRLQEADGGVRGGIESEAHTRHGEGSWQESLTLMAYAPDMWSSYLYAGAAARAAYVLRNYDAPRAADYQQSALAAMRWAERAYATPSYPKLPHEVVDARNEAALALYRLTGDSAWHELFKQTTAFTSPQRKLAEWRSHDQGDAAFLYLRMKNVDKGLQENVRKAMQNSVTDMIEQGRRTGFRWTKDNPDAWLGWGALSVPQAVNLVRWHFLTGDRRALETTLFASQYGAGANPLNMTMTTGVGKRYPLNPLHRDHRVSNQSAPPGITVNGPFEPDKLGDSWTLKVLGAKLYPPAADWPTTEFYLDIYSFEPVTEFATFTTIAQNAYVWGYLAARAK